jgi:hypothetical protein
LSGGLGVARSARGPAVLTGTITGAQDRRWLEAATLTIAILPVLVLVSYVARIVTLARTSVFIGPFSADAALE